MRPAQKAPENGADHELHGYIHEATSMRPAQKAPENQQAANRAYEAYYTSMRPAQKAPENRRHRRSLHGQVSDTSMRPAQKAPENIALDRGRKEIRDTSMRPAQKAPENIRCVYVGSRRVGYFNEAGAKSAGKPPAGRPEE